MKVLGKVKYIKQTTSVNIEAIASRISTWF